MSLQSELFSPNVIALGYDLHSIKVYEVAACALWVYDYLLTLPEEIEYLWKGKKSPVFWLFILNRYLVPIFFTLTLISYFSPLFTEEVCRRYGIMETFETALTTCVAEVLLTLRVYALAQRHKAVLYGACSIIIVQWGLMLYAMSQSLKGTANVAVLLENPTFPFPAIPDVDAYHVCIFISVLGVQRFAEAWLCLTLAFDTLAFLLITVITFLKTKKYGFIPLVDVIQKDGVTYFFVLFSSNLLWLTLLLHARPALKFIHNQSVYLPYIFPNVLTSELFQRRPAMIFSGIMINRITLNLKSANDQRPVAWAANSSHHQDEERSSQEYPLAQVYHNS